jgi:hypothetical protein
MSQFNRICNFQSLEDGRTIAVGPRHDVVRCMLTSMSFHICDKENCIIYKTYVLSNKTAQREES